MGQVCVCAQAAALPDSQGPSHEVESTRKGSGRIARWPPVPQAHLRHVSPASAEPGVENVNGWCQLETVLGQLPHRKSNSVLHTRCGVCSPSAGGTCCLKCPVCLYVCGFALLEPGSPWPSGWCFSCRLRLTEGSRHVRGSSQAGGGGAPVLEKHPQASGACLFQIAKA